MCSKFPVVLTKLFSFYRSLDTVIPLCWTGKLTGTLYGGIDYVMDYRIYIFHSNTRLYCVAICLLTYSLEVLGVEGHVHI